LSLLLTLGGAILASVSFFLVIKAVRHLEISLVAPLLALNPGVTALFGFLVLGENLERLSVLGIILMIAGSYVLTLDPEKSFLHPLKVFAKSQYVHFVFASILFYAMGATFDRTVLSVFEIPVPNYMFFFHVFIAGIFVPIVLFSGHGFGSVWASIKREKRSIFLISLFTILYRTFQMEALSVAYVGLVSAIKRSSAFFVTLIGGELFHEKNIGRKLIAALIIITGTILIIV
jgi:drug/metabolite transporter (DMT)-like permease